MGKLTERELVKHVVVEEAAEVTKIICKMGRFGDDNTNPYEPHKGSNLQLLAEEVGDLLGGLDWLIEVYRLDPEVIQIWRDEKKPKAINLNNGVLNAPLPEAA